MRGPFYIRRPVGHLVLNEALHYVWLRLRYVSITFESTRRTPGTKVAQEPALLLVYCLRTSRSSLRHLVLNVALHYVWLRLRYVSITFESTHRTPGTKVAQEPPIKLEEFPSRRLVYVWMTFRATVSLTDSLSRQIYTFLYVWCNPSTDS